ncbi:MAG: glycosyltransferase family 1 protein [Pedosphaera sp.]|nr:glycosyltransferase family 1 protein [Pedosphaera sp.]
MPPSTDIARQDRPRLLLLIDLIPRSRRPWEAWLLGLAGQLRTQGAELVLVITGPAPEWFQTEFHDAGGQLACCESLRNRFDAQAAAELVHRFQPVVLLLMFYPMLASKVLRLTFRHPVKHAFYIDQSSLEVPVRSGIAKMLVWLRGRIGARCYRKIITVSDFNADRLRQRLGIPASRLVRIHNGVELDRFKNPPVSAPETARPFFYAGQIADYKGVPTLIKAYAQVRAVRPNAPPLFLAGEGRMRQKLTDEVAAMGFSGHIHFLGQVGDVPERMMSALCSIIPSEWDEASAFSAIEAMAAGRLVIASDAGSLPELLGGLGRLYPRGNAAALTASLVGLLDSSPAELDAAGAALRSRAQAEFGMEKMIESYLRVLRPCLRST